MAMSDIKYVLGIDPGETVGICLLVIIDGRVTAHDIAQCNRDAAPEVIDGLTSPYSLSKQLWATEQFVVGSRAGRSGNASAGAATRGLINGITAKAELAGVRCVLRSASEVKPWATNERLKAVGVKGVGGHSMDGARHALFAAVKAGYCKDPLSKSYGVKS